jgi:hypothetical protein
MAGLCKDCRYWDRLEQEVTDLIDFDPPYGTCMLVESAVDQFPGPSATFPYRPGTLALVSDVNSFLVTKPEFGCVQFEAGRPVLEQE